MKAEEKKLLALFRKLDESQRRSLQDFAEFLAQRTPKPAEPLPEPVLLPAAEDESVVAAIKRLAASYPMLDRGKMLNETSVLMTQHVVQGRDRKEVIEELELVFQRHYQDLKAREDGAT